MSFNWTQLIPAIGDEHTAILGVTDHHDKIALATAGIATGIIVVSSVIARISLGSGENAITPAGSISVRGLFEGFTDLIVYLIDMVIGKDKREVFTPLFGSIFCFVLFNNVLGLVPGMTAATENINLTLAIGIFTFVIYNVLGLKVNGFGYIKHLFGPVLLLAPLMFVIELVSHFVRPFSLGLRLSGNMTGDHTVLGIFLDLVPIGVPMIFYVLGLFVSFVQAFVFTLLSMVYVSMAIAHDEH